MVALYHRLLKWYLIPPCLTLSNIRYVSRVKWSNPVKGVAPSPTPRCSSYRKASLLVTLDFGHQFTYLLYHVTEAVQVQAVNSIVVVGALTRCSLLHFVCDLKAALMNVHRCLIREFMLYYFEVGQNAAETTKNICWAKGEDTVDHSRVTRWFKKFRVLDLTLNHLIVRLQPWRFVKCWIPLHYHCSQVHPDP